MEQIIYNIANSIYWWQVRKNIINGKYIFVLLKLGKWTTETDANPDEIKKTWLEIERKVYNSLEEAGDKMIKSIVNYKTPITGHGY